MADLHRVRRPGGLEVQPRPVLHDGGGSPRKEALRAELPRLEGLGEGVLQNGLIPGAEPLVGLDVEAPLGTQPADRPSDDLPGDRSDRLDPLRSHAGCAEET